MAKKCLLETDGYRVSFDLNSGENSKEYVDLVVELTLNKHLGSVAVRSVTTCITISDLWRLTAYFEEHIERLRQDFDSESYAFVPMELGFQVQALEGEIQQENDGEFSIRFLVNVGEGSKQNHRVYIGGESVVTLKNIRRFIVSLHEALASFSRSSVGAGPA
jgi:hypothetical protein